MRDKRNSLITEESPYLAPTAWKVNTNLKVYNNGKICLLRKFSTSNINYWELFKVNSILSTVNLDSSKRIRSTIQQHFDKMK